MIIDEKDNVEVREDGHKYARRAIAAGEDVIKYGMPIGHATCAIAAGEHVHAHNVATNLDRAVEYRYEPSDAAHATVGTVRDGRTIMAYRHPDGRIGIRNDLWVVPLVGCVNTLARRLAASCGGLALTHPYGCSQLGADHETTANILAALCRHPNAGGVLVVALGCENNTLESFAARLGFDPTTFDVETGTFKPARQEGLEAANFSTSQPSNSSTSQPPNSSIRPFADFVRGLKVERGERVESVERGERVESVERVKRVERRESRKILDAQKPNSSTSQLLNSSTSQPPNFSTSQLPNTSTSQLLNTSTSQLLNSSTSQPPNIRFLRAQDAGDEFARGLALLKKLEAARPKTREPVSVSELVVGLKCGGSDGFSGLTANPLVGRFSDWLVARGGATVLTEVPEMFGAETLLMKRCRTRVVFDRCVKMIEDFKAYYARHGQPCCENPSPGNKAGGITTLEDKSLGCVQKGGSAPVEDVLDYGERVTAHGLTLLTGPGNDLVASTVLAAAGCHLVLFTTGRGTPFGTVVPTVKIASNTALATRKPGWIDWDAMAEPSVESFAARILAIASGDIPAQNERAGAQEIAIFKDGVTL